LEKTKENRLLKQLKFKQIEKYFENYELDKALNDIFAFVDVCNEYVQSKKPWETHDKQVLYELVDSIKSIAILLWPFIPQASEKIAKELGFEIKFENIEKNLSYKGIKKADILFKKIDVEEIKEDKQNINKDKINVKSMADIIKYDDVQNAHKKSILEQPKNSTQGIVNFSDFAKLDLRVGTIKKAEDIPAADKLLKLEVDVGESNHRTILAGIKKYYSKNELIGKQIIVIVNLEPRIMKGIESKGMLLAAGSPENDTCVLISPDKKVKNGEKIS
jgi:methionyl-tRNA synthetase